MSAQTRESNSTRNAQQGYLIGTVVECSSTQTGGKSNNNQRPITPRYDEIWIFGISSLLAVFGYQCSLSHRVATMDPMVRWMFAGKMLSR